MSIKRVMAENLFAVVPIEAIQDRRLTLEQTRVLIALFSFRNKVTNTVWPSRSAISERTGMHPSNISSATTSLVHLGWLTKQGLGGFSKASRYTLSVPDLSAPTVADSARVVKPTTVAERATVAESATVAERATTPLAESATTPLADSAIRTEQSIEQSIEQSTSTGAPSALPAKVFLDAPAKLPKAKKTKDDETQDTALQTSCKATWAAYSREYATKYSAAPVRNAKVNANVKAFVQRIGYEESPGVAAFFVGRVNEAFVVRKMHEFGLLLAGAESYRTQWATNQSMTATRADQIDKTQTNFNSAGEAMAILRAKREMANA